MTLFDVVFEKKKGSTTSSIAENKSAWGKNEVLTFQLLLYVECSLASRTRKAITATMIREMGYILLEDMRELSMDEKVIEQMESDWLW